MTEKNRDGYTVDYTTVESVEVYESGGCSIKKSDGWSFFLDSEEIRDYTPQVGDSIVMYMQGFNTIAGVTINNHSLRYRTPKQLEREHKAMLDGFRLEKLERYVKYGDDLKARVKNLHPDLQARMNRFAEESGVEFWIDSAPYEMACLEGAQALLNATKDYGDDALALVEYWAGYNTQSGGYQYDKQMELVPDFGEGHSGNTYGVAVSMAKMILRGEGDKLR